MEFSCYNCEKPGHMARYCWNIHCALFANFTEESVVAMILEINIIMDSEGWWVDIGVSRHVCYDCALFKKYFEADDKKVF